MAWERLHSGAIEGPYDPHDRSIDGFVSPNANHAPTQCFQKPVGITVAPAIFQYLCLPRKGVCLRPGRVSWTTVPKTTICEYHYPSTRENNVGGAALVGQEA